MEEVGVEVDLALEHFLLKVKVEVEHSVKVVDMVI